MQKEVTAEIAEAQGVVKGLFLGDVRYQELFPFPVIAQAEQETLRAILDSIRKFLAPREDFFRTADVSGTYPDSYIQELRELGLFALIIPEDHDGLGLSNLGYARVLEETSMYDPSTSITIGAHSSIGMKGIILFGNSEQKRRYLPKLASGELIAAFCLTEPSAGSDAASIRTTAEKLPDGSWKLNGEKIWISNAPIAGLFTVFARTDATSGKLSAFIVDRNTPGISVGPKEDKMGIRASATSSVVFENVIVPEANLLGEAGKGFKIAMSILNNGRTGLGGGSVGGMKRVLELATTYAKERKQFGRPIVEFGLVREKLARMALNCYAAESAVGIVGKLIDEKSDDYSLEAAASKIFSTEALWLSVNEGLQIAGGNGFMRDYPYERLLRDSRINMIFEGTNEILRLYIALSGYQEVGNVFTELKSGLGNFLHDPIKGFGVLGSYAARRFSPWSSIKSERLELAERILPDETASLKWLTTQFARGIEALLRAHGKNIVGKQLLSKRVADSAIDLFVASSMLSRVHSAIEAQGKAQTVAEQLLLKLFLSEAKRRVSGNLRLLSHNDDALIESIAQNTIEHGYNWDWL
ncbi:acyl-CoA dehydrogenase family protein [bacterium]|nr:acyl-CoA dehydrogenase family protein [bacterium]